MVLAMQFNSFLHPLTVMLALPLSTVGAFGALYITGDTNIYYQYDRDDYADCPGC